MKVINKEKLSEFLALKIKGHIIKIPSIYYDDYYFYQAKDDYSCGTQFYEHKITGNLYYFPTHDGYSMKVENFILVYGDSYD